MLVYIQIGIVRMSVECVILAAGLSSRMGENKMLLPFHGSTILEQCIKSFYKTCSRIIIVVGKYHEDIQKRITSYNKVQLVYNKNYNGGMFESVKVGVNEIAADRFFITPGDYPLIQIKTIEFMSQINAPFVSPGYQGKYGHPILLNVAFKPIIIQSDAKSLRDCLGPFEKQRYRLITDDQGILIDVDTKESYQNIIRTIQ